MWFSVSVLMAGAATGADLLAPAGPLVSTEAVSFTFKATGVAFLDGCAPVELEKREGEAWVALPRTSCAQRPPATRVEGALVLSVPPPGPGEFRAVAAFGRRCGEGRPFAQAGCVELGVARSAPFVVLAPAPVTTPK